MRYIRLEGTRIVALLTAEAPPDASWQDAGDWPGFSERPTPGWQPHLIDGAVVWHDHTSERIAAQWEAVRAERKRRFEPGDDEAKKAFRLGLPMPTAWAAHQQALADVTLQPDPFNIIWPTPPA